MSFKTLVVKQWHSQRSADKVQTVKSTGSAASGSFDHLPEDIKGQEGWSQVSEGPGKLCRCG